MTSTRATRDLQAADSAGNQCKGCTTRERRFAPAAEIRRKMARERFAHLRGEIYLRDFYAGRIIAETLSKAE
jgi:hypothetical protein